VIQNRYITPITRQLQRELNITLVNVPALYFTPANAEPAAAAANTGTAELRSVQVTPAATPFDGTDWRITFQANPAGGVQFIVEYRNHYLGGAWVAAPGVGTTGANFNTARGVTIPSASWVAAATAAVGDRFTFFTLKAPLETGAWFPGVQNAQVANNIVLAPDPQGPMIAATDVIKADYEAALAGLGLTFTYPAPDDEFMWYHEASGEVHCGSNRFSDPYPQAGNRWWVQPPPAPAGP
jgi:hypothetical protein